jgi:hypothetical protein
MVCHATKTVDAAVELLYDVLYDEVQTVPVAFVEKNRLTSVTSEYNMVDSAGKMNARFTCHRRIIH